MNALTKSLWISAGMFLGIGLGFAQMEHHNVSFMESMNAAMTRMDRDMASARMSGDVDRDFAKMMIPHHQGAIDMAKAELKYGKDPVMIRLAQEIIVDQQSEIEAMHLRLAKSTAARKENK